MKKTPHALTRLFTLLLTSLTLLSISDRGVKATAATTKLLVRGTYEVK